MTGVTFGRVVRSEWTKLRSLRSTWLILGVAVLLTVAFSTAFGYGYGSQIRTGEVTPSPGKAVDVTYIGLDLAAVIVGVVGILQMTGEYGSGLIRASLTAVPRRWPLLPAKALVLALTVAATMGPAGLVSFLVTQAMIGPDGVTLDQPGAARAVLGATVYPVATALLGLAAGTVLRHAGVAITVFVTGLLILPALLVPALPEAAEKHVLPYLPVTAAQAVYTQVADTGIDLPSPWSGLLVLTGWVLGLTAAGIAVLTRRDA